MKQFFYSPSIVEYVAGITVALATGLCLFPPPGARLVWWEMHAFELMIIFLLSGLLFFFINKKWLMIISFAGCASLCYFLHSRTVSHLKQAERSEDAFSMQVGAFRLSQTASCIESTLSSIIHSDLDIITLQEVPSAKLQRIHDTLVYYGYAHYQFKSDRVINRETAVYSRFPIEFFERSRRKGDLSTILGRIYLSQEDTLQEIHFLYTSMPEIDSLTEHTFSKLYTLGQHLGETQSPILAMGNFNLVSWSYHLQVFKNKSALQDSRRGVLPASRQGYLTLFERPTEHIFYSDHFKCTRFESISACDGNNIGMIGTYQLKFKGRQNYVLQTSQEF